MISSDTITVVVAAVVLGALQGYSSWSSAKKLAVIHTLVNAPLGAALEKSASSAERLAVINNTTENQTAATIARKMSDDHNAAQAEVDKKL